MSMELIVDEVKKQKITIKNKAELVEELKDKLVVYDKVITEDMLTEGKQDRAKLNKLFDAIEAKRKEIKSEIMIPYDEVESDFKEITGLIKEASNKIDVQVKKYEEEKKAEKRSEIENYFNSVISYGFVKIDKVFSEKWLNSSTSMKSIQDEINDLEVKVAKDIEAIKALECKHEVALISKYEETLDIGTVVLEKAKLEKLEAEQTRIRELQEKARQEADDRRQSQEPYTAPQQVEQAETTNITSDNTEVFEMLHRTFEVWGSKDQIIALGNFMNQNSIKFKKIEGVN